MKKFSFLNVLKLAGAAALIVSMAACENSSSSDDPVVTGFTGTPTYLVTWDGAFAGGANSGAAIRNADGTLVKASTETQALQAASASTMVATGGFFDDTAINFTTAGGDWGGCFMQYIAPDTTIDISDATKIYVAVKGDLGATAYFGIKLESTNVAWPATRAATELNFLSYPAATENGWTIYTIPLADFTAVDFADFGGIGVWNANIVDGTVAERESPATNYLPLSDVLISIAFE